MNDRHASALVSHVAGEGNLPKFIIRTSGGASAEIYRHGAHVTSWRPGVDGEERLFLSERSQFREGTAIRGGVPIIFPQFALEGHLPRHGFARTSTWTFESAIEDSGGDAVVTLVLEDSPETFELWPARFRCRLTVQVGGEHLLISLAVENVGDTPFDFAAALHSYLQVDDVTQAQIIGLQNVPFRSAAGELRADPDETLRVKGEVDRVYVGAPAHLTLREPRRTLSIDRVMFNDVVIWNPGPENTARLSDMVPGSELHMLCIEAAEVQTRIPLPPKGRWCGSQEFIARADELAQHSERI